jgi:adenylyltransferase/sulfurtransferase
MLSQEEQKRYNRHLILEELGPTGQEKLKAAKVLVIGAGGLGCPILQYLTAAGVGTIGIVDFDEVSLSNLQRQILFTENDLGKNKAAIAAERLKQLNRHVDFVVIQQKLTANNALQFFEPYDLIVDGTDNFSTRYLVNDAAVITKKPLVYGSIYKFQGQIAVFNYQDGPSYRCLFPIPPEYGTIKNCAEIGVVGVLPGIVGTQQANEALKIILGIGTVLTGKLMIYDALTANYTTLTIERSENEISKVVARAINFADFDYDLFCGVPAQQETEFKLSEVLDNEDYQLVDLRELWEEPQLEGTNLIRIQMGELTERLSEVSRTKKVILICQTGFRSAQAKEFLIKFNNFTNVEELKGGIENND